jgi:phasin family protein
MNNKSKIGETVEAAADAANKGIDQTAGSLKTSVADTAYAMENAQTKVKEGMNKVIKTAEELVQFNQGNIEAFVRSGQIWAAGVQDLTKQAAASAQASFDETVSTLKALSGVRSVKEAIDLQTNLARSSVEKAVAESSRLADASVKLAEQTLAPLTARVKLAVETFAKPV